MESYLQKFHAAKADAGRIEDRGDMVALRRIIFAMRLRLPINLIVAMLPLAHGVREPDYVDRFLHDLTAAEFEHNNDAVNIEIILDCFSNLRHMHVRRKYNPARLFNTYARPASMMENFVAVNLLAFANMIAPMFAGELTRVEHRQIVRDMKRRFRGVGTYWAEHFFRTLTIVFDRPFPGSSFVVMGSGANKAAYDRLRALGVHNMNELNVHLVEPLDAGRFAYYVCMGKL